jgi:ABC-type multidrug transport system fused ATPase/permease subunit
MSVPRLLLRLWRLCSVRRRKQFILVLFLAAVTSFAEILSIGSAIPFLWALTNPDKLLQNIHLQYFFELFGITQPSQLLLPLTFGFGIAILAACAMRLILLWSSTCLSHLIGSDLSINIYKHTLYQPYQVHCSRNTSEVITGISVKANSAIGVLTNALNLFSATIILASITTTLMFFNPIAATSVFLGFGFIYLGVVIFTRKRQLISSKKIARESTFVIKALQEGLGGIRDVLIDGSQAAYTKIYSNSDLQLRHAQGSNSFISASPRYLVEALGVVLLTGVAYFLALQPGGIEKAIPVLGVLALGAQRMLPLLQKAYASWTGIRGEQVALGDALDFLDQPLPDYLLKADFEPMIFKDKIELIDLSFQYGPNLPWVIKDLNLSIKKGERVGFIGSTGSGKSTLMDLMMGLIQPITGSLKIDGVPIALENNRAWQAHIAHVPQVIFLADASVAENIAFGVPFNEIEMNRVKDAARRAQIDVTIERWQGKYNTRVGERGIRLSGGQRQRIGIARALYKNADIIIFDEATSALDNETELAVMEAIETLSDDLTIMIIAHRISTLRGCSRIVELSQDSGCRILDYQDIGRP